jgi:sulfite reductase (ferredoxin)
MYPAYHVVAGASVGKDAKLAEIIGEVSAFDLPRFTADVLQNFLLRKSSYAAFSDYVEGEGRGFIAKLTEKYRDIPEFRDDKNYYFDWGSDQIFSLAAKGVGECSAGLFDMIDVDLNTINQSRSLIDDGTDNGNLNSILYGIVFASSRMLLITRGSEPKNTTEVFNEFLARFIDAHLISSVFREIVEIARDNRDFDFSGKQETILDLAQAIITLYENMDDSLQFKNLESKSQTEPDKKTQPNKRNKDFRGIACPMNFVKTKIELATLKSGDLLEILLDDGEPIENVPGSIRGEGHEVLKEVKQENYWKVVIKKA